MARVVKQRLSVKNPDFDLELRDAGMSMEGAEKVRKLAEFGEYYAFEIQFDSDTGKVVGARQVKAE